MNGKVTYRQQFTRCGKKRCRKCQEGQGHGPYWYAYWSENGRTVSKYIGVHLPEHVVLERKEAANLKKDDAVASQQKVTAQTTPVLRIYLLGQFRIERWQNNSWQPVDNRIWHRRRARALLGCLLSSSGRRLGREQVMDHLWPELEIDIAANRLNGAVHELRLILEPGIPRPAASRMLRLERDILELADRTQIWVDAEEFEHLLKEADVTIDLKQKQHLLEDAAGLYHGPYLLEELYVEWAMQRRDTLQRAWISLLLGLAQVQVTHKEFVSAIETLDRLRTADPSNETALQRLMILLTQLDRRGEALKIYTQHVTMLQRDYECDPLPETIELYEKLRQGHIPTLSPSVPKTLPVQQSTSKQQAGETGEKLVTPVKQQPATTPGLPRPAFQVGRQNQTPLIGRTDELHMLRQVMLTLEDRASIDKNQSIDSVHNQPVFPRGASYTQFTHTHFLLLKGESGIGKTRLAEELSLEAYQRGWTVAWSRSYEQEGTIPYHPWTELLRILVHNSSLFNTMLQDTITHENPSSSLIIRLGRIRALLPELVLPTGETIPTTPVSQEQERLYLWEAVLSLLSLLSTAHPLLLVLDDLHWADESSIELLTYLIHHLQDQRVLLIGTCRDGELAPQHKLQHLITDLRREQAISIVPILPLTQTQILALLAHVPTHIAENIQLQAAGNPFFAEELARYVGNITSEEEPQFPLPTTVPTQYAAYPQKKHVDRTTTPPHTLTSSDRTLPEAISSVLERRLSKLSRNCQTLLGKAAVLGGSFGLRQLMPMVNEQDEDTVLDLLEEALHAGLLLEEGTGAHITYHFWHPLIISHLYNHLSAARRAQLHRKAADALCATTTQPEKVAAAIVYHLGKGGGNLTRLAQYAELTGDHAYALAAYTEAQKYYLQVLQALTNQEWHESTRNDNPQSQIQQLLEKESLSYSFPEPLRVCRILERMAECGRILGKFTEARQLYQTILHLRTSQQFQSYFQQQVLNGTMTEEKEIQLQALLWREIGTTYAATGEYEQAYLCYGQGKKVLSQAGLTRSAAWAGLQVQYGAMLRLEGKYHEARQHLEEALAMLQQIVPLQPSTPTLMENKITLSQHNLARDPSKSGTKLTFSTRIERALHSDHLEIGYAHERLGIVAASLGEPQLALQHLHTALTIYEQDELVSEMARVCGNLGAVYITKGEPEIAKIHMQRSLELAERGEDLPNMAFVMLNLGDAARRSGDLLTSESWYQQSLTIAERINDRERISWCSAELAEVQEDLGKIDEATSSIRKAFHMGRVIKNSRCIHHALIGVAGLRIAQATAQTYAPQNPAPDKARQYLRRARSTLQRIITFADIEIENLVESKYLLAMVYFLMENLETAQNITKETLKDAQKYGTTRIIGHAYRLLGCLASMERHYQQSIHYYQQAIALCQTHGLRLDYARALYGYGLTLLQYQQEHSTQPSMFSSADTSPQQQIQRALQEAREIFEQCHASVDLLATNNALSQLHVSTASTKKSMVQHIYL